MKFRPSVVEPSFGIGRVMYSLLEHVYAIREEDKPKETSETKEGGNTKKKKDKKKKRKVKKGMKIWQVSKNTKSERERAIA